MTTSILWHYTTVAAALGILEQGALRASDIRFLNDSGEYTLAVQLLREVMRESLESNEREFGREFRDRMELALTGNRPYSPGFSTDFGYFAACVSETYDDLGQWRGYADGGGLALGFDANLLKLAAEESGFRLAKCIYSPTEQKELLRHAFDSALDAMAPELEDHWHKAVNRAIVDLVREFDGLAPRIKHVAFSAESEWRLIKGPISYGEDSSDCIRTRPGKSIPIPYVDLPLSTKCVPKLIRCVAVGPTPHPDLARIAIRRVARTSGLTTDDFEVQVTTVPYRAW